MPSISIIIPVLNEAQMIARTISKAQTGTDIEIIVVDGGSNDGTVEIAHSLNVQLISTIPGRATQMNQGAANAKGDILIFLHGDTLLPAGFDSLVREALGKTNTIAGAFELSIGGKASSLRLVEKIVNWRSLYLEMPYGDQGIFLKANIFKEVGGFPTIPIMEDFELIRQLRKKGQIEIVSAPVLTSGRRWQKFGILKTTLINQIVIISYLLGVSPEILAQWYRGQIK